jgi:hypothetical protein
MSSAPLALLVLQEDFFDCVHCFLSVVSISNYNFSQGMAVQCSLLDCHATEQPDCLSQPGFLFNWGAEVLLLKERRDSLLLSALSNSTN